MTPQSLAACALLLASVLLYLGRIDGAQWLSALQWIGGLVVAARIGEPVATATAAAAKARMERQP